MARRPKGEKRVITKADVGTISAADFLDHECVIRELDGGSVQVVVQKPGGKEFVMTKVFHGESAGAQAKAFAEESGVIVDG